jgi:two-component system phosphate regulon sensor histidine kinase PhoR
MTPQLQRELVFLATLLFVLFVFGAVFGAISTFLIIGLLFYTAWSLFNLNRLNRWLAKPSKHSPEAIGVWDDIYFQLHNLYKRQRNARKKLASMLKRFQKSTQALPYATIVLNQYNEIEWMNPAAGQLLGFHHRIDIGQRIDNLIRLPDFSRYLNKKKFDVPLRFTIDNRKLILSITPYGNDQYLLSARDITSLSKIDDMRRDFISNASHELRTPLTVISGYVEYLSYKAADDARVPLENISEQIERMNGIISELIELARLESSQSVDFTVSVEIDDLINEVYRDARELDQDNHHITLDIDTDSLNKMDKLKLYGNYDELRMALSNLMTNAVRYTPDDGDIKLFVSANDTTLSVGVQDTGVGISYQHIPRLTERFYRVDEGRSREVGGTGLGLAIVKHVLDRHNAELHIQSEEGKGSLFRCDFPLSNVENLDL